MAAAADSPRGLPIQGTVRRRATWGHPGALPGALGAQSACAAPLVVVPATSGLLSAALGEGADLGGGGASGAQRSRKRASAALAVSAVSLGVAVLAAGGAIAALARKSTPGTKGGDGSRSAVPVAGPKGDGELVKGFSGRRESLTDAPGGLRVGGWSLGPALGAWDPAVSSMLESSSSSPSSSYSSAETLNHVGPVTKGKDAPFASFLELRDPGGALALRLRPGLGPDGTPSVEGPLVAPESQRDAPLFPAHGSPAFSTQPTGSAAFTRVQVTGAAELPDATGTSDSLILEGGRVSVHKGKGQDCTVLSRQGLREQCGLGLRIEASDSGIYLGGEAVAVKARGGLSVSAGAASDPTAPPLAPGMLGATVRLSRIPRGGFSLATDARQQSPPSSSEPLAPESAVTLTVAGHECQFPMLIAGTEHYACVPFEGSYWCIDSQGLWDKCAGQSGPDFEQNQIRQKSVAPPPGSREGDLEVRAAGNLTLTTGASGGAVWVRGGGGVTLQGGVTVAAAPGPSSLRVHGLTDLDTLRVGSEGLEVQGAVSADGGLRVEGGTRLAGGLSVGGPADFSAGLTTSGPASFRAPEPTVFVGGARLGSSLEVATETQLQGPLFVAGESSLQSLRLSGNADVAGKGSFARLAARRSLTVHGRLDVPGVARVSNLTVDGLTVHNLTVTGNILGLPLGTSTATPGGASAQMVANSQDLRVQNSLRVGGAAFLDQGLQVAGPVQAARGLDVEGLSELERAQVHDLEILSSLDVKASARFRNRPVFENGFAVRGRQISTFTGRADFEGDVYIAGALGLTGQEGLQVQKAEVDTLSVRALQFKKGGEIRGTRRMATEQLNVGQSFPPSFDEMSLLVGGSGVVSGTFTLGESMAVGGDVNVPDGRVMAGHLASSASLEVGGDGVVEGALSVVGEVLTMGAARLGADLSVAGEAKVGQDLIVRGGAIVGGDLVVENLVVKGEIRREGGGASFGQTGPRQGIRQREPRSGRGRHLSEASEFFFDSEEDSSSYVETDVSMALPGAISLVAVTKCGIDLRLPACRDPGRVVSVRDISGSASPGCRVAVAGDWGGAQRLIPGPTDGCVIALEEPFAALDAFCTRSGRWYQLSGVGRHVPPS